MPDLDLDTPAGPTRVYTLLHEAKPVLLNFGAPRRIDISSWAERVRAVDVRFTGTWELPVLGKVASPTAVLVRPDGHVGWVDRGAEEPLTDALTSWFGPKPPPPDER
jgi:3-(3-hydroxy-phenyl)propionate hydroxylase